MPPSIDWDKWRVDYPSMSFADQQEFYRQAAEAHPDQRHYDFPAAEAFIRLARPSIVVEVGGWRGELAADILPLHPEIVYWFNYEIAPNLKPLSDPAYRHVTLKRWPWLEGLVGNALVLSHVAEHILLEEVRGIVKAFTGKWVYIDAPLENGPSDWAGYHGSHILEVGWDGLEEMLNEEGFPREAVLGETARCYRRR